MLFLIDSGERSVTHSAGSFSANRQKRILFRTDEAKNLPRGRVFPKEGAERHISIALYLLSLVQDLHKN